jgi:arylsulfatase A-like enzyme
MKQVPSDFGGTRNGMVVSLAQGHQGEERDPHQFSHVIDVAPTVLQAIGLPEPKVVNGTKQIPMEGTSLEVFLRGRQGEGTTHHAVLRDRRQPRDLP